MKDQSLSSVQTLGVSSIESPLSPYQKSKDSKFNYTETKKSLPNDGNPAKKSRVITPTKLRRIPSRDKANKKKPTVDDDSGVSL